MNTPEPEPRPNRTLPMAAIILGVTTATITLGSVTLGAYQIEINHDGQVLLIGTTTAVMFFFVGIVSYWRANDRERAAVRREREAEETGRFAAIAERLVFKLTRIEEQLEKHDQMQTGVLSHLVEAVGEWAASTAAIDRRIPHPVRLRARPQRNKAKRQQVPEAVKKAYADGYTDAMVERSENGGRKVVRLVKPREDPTP